MKKIIALAIFGFLTFAVNAQEISTDTIAPIEKKVKGLQSVPEFPGGLKEFYNLIVPKIQRSMRYTPGRMIVAFIVEKDGSVTEITTIEGINEKFDERVREIIAKSPRWKPGEQEGKPIRARYRIPFTFR